MTAQKQTNEKTQGTAACDDQAVERTPEEKARILARLQCMLAQLRASNGDDHGNT